MEFNGKDVVRMSSQRGIHRDSLFRVVRRIGEHTREKAACNTVRALDHKPMFICFHEFGIHEKQPDRPEELALAEAQNLCRRRSAESIGVRLLEIIWYLKKGAMSY